MQWREFVDAEYFRMIGEVLQRSSDCQCGHFSRNIAYFTPKLTRKNKYYRIKVSRKQLINF